MRATIVITTAHEVELAKRCILSVSISRPGDTKILVVSPDTELAQFCSGLENTVFFRDNGKGKIQAMNIALELVETDVVVWTDGDCEVRNIRPLLNVFGNEKVGAAGGSVHPKESRDTKFGFFHHFLTSAANDARARRAKKEQFIELPGYLWAFRKKLVTEIPYNAAEDSVIPLAIFNKGYKVAYVPESEVYVHGPTNVKDWLSQKTRTAKAHEKLKNVKGAPLMKTFGNEIREGVKFSLRYKYKNVKERFWLLQLMFLRVYMWLKLKTMPAYGDNWKPAESTKR